MSGKKDEIKNLVVKGYMRPDGTSYYVAIPKEIRELLGLTGGEYFALKAKKEDKKISLKLVEFPDEEDTEKSNI